MIFTWIKSLLNIKNIFTSSFIIIIISTFIYLYIVNDNKKEDIKKLKIENINKEADYNIETYYQDKLNYLKSINDFNDLKKSLKKYYKNNKTNNKSKDRVIIIKL